MDKETRGVIENALDEGIEGSNVKDIIDWVQDGMIPIGSPEDLALGYMLGSLARLAHRIALGDKITKKMDKEYEKKFGKKFERPAPSKDSKRLRIYLTKRDIDEIRDMLKRRIMDIKSKITRDLNV